MTTCHLDRKTTAPTKMDKSTKANFNKQNKKNQPTGKKKLFYLAVIIIIVFPFWFFMLLLVSSVLFHFLNWIIKNKVLKKKEKPK